MFEYSDFKLEDALYATLHSWEDSRDDYLSEADESWQPVIKAVEELANAVIRATQDLSVPGQLEGILAAGTTPKRLFEDPALNHLRKLALERIQVHVGFANSTDVEGQAERALELTEFLLDSEPPEEVVRFVRRLTRCFVLGLHPECVVLCRAILETALKAGYRTRGAGAPGGLAQKISKAEAEGWLSTDARRAATTVRVRGNKAVHDDPTATEDVLGTIQLTVQVLRELL